VRSEIRDLVVGFSRILDGIYRVAGRQDLGDRIRLPLPHSTSSDEADEPESPTGDPGSDPSSLPEPAVRSLSTRLRQSSSSISEPRARCRVG
jgi:hypothetical protein